VFVAPPGQLVSLSTAESYIQALVSWCRWKPSDMNSDPMALHGSRHSTSDPAADCRSFVSWTPYPLWLLMFGLSSVHNSKTSATPHVCCLMWCNRVTKVQDISKRPPIWALGTLEKLWSLATDRQVLDTVLLTWVRLVTRSTLQSWKWPSVGTN